jgi:predicted Zn finger-like uncharacterized protein
MQGTTVCPHCDARFKITKEQLAAHHGMVRCGHCMEPFDTHPNFAPDQLDLQLELPILEESVSAPYSKMVVLQPMTLAEQVAFMQDNKDNEIHTKTGSWLRGKDGGEFQPKRRSWPWAIAAFLLLLVLFAQAAYFFRVDLAARLPILKPALSGYCRILKCTVPLPQHTDLIGIESSDLVADPANEIQITLNALLRNRAPYAQAFPNLELTLNDTQDKPLARRVFHPAEYLPPQEIESAGLSPNHEISIKLHLGTANLKPAGYRLVLLYSNN